MVVNSITVYTYLNKCPVRYNQINWRPSWYVFLRIQNKEIRETEFHKFFKKQTLSKVLAWYDTQILQQIGIASKTTLEVRIRIVCGMVNKLPIEVLTRDLKIEFMECIWDTFRSSMMNGMSGIADIYCNYLSRVIVNPMTITHTKARNYDR